MLLVSVRSVLSRRRSGHIPGRKSILRLGDATHPEFGGSLEGDAFDRPGDDLESDDAVCSRQVVVVFHDQVEVVVEIHLEFFSLLELWDSSNLSVLCRPA